MNGKSRGSRWNPYCFILFRIDGSFNLGAQISDIRSGWNYGCKEAQRNLKIIVTIKF